MVVARRARIDELVGNGLSVLHGFLGQAHAVLAVLIDEEEHQRNDEYRGQEDDEHNHDAQRHDASEAFGSFAHVEEVRHDIVGQGYAVQLDRVATSVAYGCHHRVFEGSAGGVREGLHLVVGSGVVGSHHCRSVVVAVVLCSCLGAESQRQHHCDCYQILVHIIHSFGFVFIL